MWRYDDAIFKTNLYFGFHLTTRKNSSRFQFLLSVIEIYVLNLCLWFWLPATERDGRVNLVSYREQDQINDDDIKRMTQKYDCSCTVGQHWRQRHAKDSVSLVNIWIFHVVADFDIAFLPKLKFENIYHLFQLPSYCNILY